MVLPLLGSGLFFLWVFRLLSWGTVYHYLEKPAAMTVEDNVTLK